MLMNPDHAMTEDQEILSQRGLSFRSSDSQNPLTRSRQQTATPAPTGVGDELAIVNEYTE